MLIKSSVIVASFLIWLFFILPLNGQIVARVGNYEITAEQLSQEIEFISSQSRYETLGYLERREIALENLINEQLIYNYARENRIEVTEDEVEQYFIAQFGDLPRFTTDGFFDMNKFRALKRTPEVQRILNELYRELLIIKTETILKNRFLYPDNVLFDRYVMENTDIDLSYAVINEEDVNLPFFIHPFEAYDYYRKNRRRYQLPQYSNVEFFIIPYGKYYEALTISEAEIDEYFLEIDFVPEQLRRETSEIIRKEKARSLALNEAERILKSLANGLPVDIKKMEIRVYDSYFADFNRESVFTRYNQVTSIERSALNEYSQPVETEFGYLVYRVIGRERMSNPLVYPLARKIWQDFIRDRVSREYKQQYEEYYRTNLSDFIVPAVHITRLTIHLEDMESKLRVTDRMLRSFYESNRHLFTEEEQNIPFRDLRERVRRKYFENELEKLKEWCRENIILVGYDMLPSESRDLPNGINLTNEVVFLEEVPNKELLSDRIKAALLAEQDYQPGSIETEREIVFYRVNSYFPAYIPSYEDVEELLVSSLGIDSEDTELDYQDYYTQNLNLFTAPDSIRVSGVFIPIEADTLRIEEADLRQYYQSNMERFYSEPEVIFEYIYLKDPDAKYLELVERINNWLDEQASFAAIQFCFGTDLPYPQNQTFPQSKLSSFFKERLQRLSAGQRSSPVYHEDGWYIFRKIRDVEPRIASYYEVREQLRDDLLRKEADSIAYEKARQLFVEITNINDLRNFPDTLLVFETGKKGINQEFDPLGRIDAYAQRIVNLRRNEKLNTLYRNDDGYGIVFLLEKDVNQYYSYDEALPMITRLLSEEQRGENARNYIRQLRDMIITETDSDSLLVFFGGWRRETNLTLDCSIPRIRYSKLIIEDAVNREVGEVSHVMKIGDSEYTFYRVDRKQRVGHDTFQFVRDDYRAYVADLEFQNWLKHYRESTVVEKY